MSSLPRPRGPVTEKLLAALRTPPHGLEPVTGDVDDEDLHLALYCCYELHYRGFEGVDDRWEWEQSLLALRAECDPDLRAIVADGSSLTYAELDAASAGLAARLVAAGVVKGDRVGLQGRNSVEWAVVAYAALRIGAVLVPLSTLLRPP